MLNLGCGLRTHPAWKNVDFISTGPGVIAHDLNKGIPFGDQSFDVVYHSHVLEHFPPGDGQGLMTECFRVLRPGGVVRVAVPDLEGIARGYLEALSHASAGESGWEDNYDWMMIELYDQVVRSESGGQMARYLRRDDIRNWQYVVRRIGAEAERAAAGKGNGVTPKRRGLVRRLAGALARPGLLRRRLGAAVLGRDGAAALRLAEFRMRGEVHQWMYDRFSLSRLLTRVGFEGVAVRSATESYVTDWSQFNLDTNPDGTVYKPDSLFVEGRRGAGVA
jgi:SAM-dependent methyltransferase